MMLLSENIFGLNTNSLIGSLNHFTESGQSVRWLEDQDHVLGARLVMFFKPEVCQIGGTLLAGALQELERRAEKHLFRVFALYGIAGRKLVDSGTLSQNYRRICDFASIEMPMLGLDNGFRSAAQHFFGEPVPVLGANVLARKGVSPQQLFQEWVSAKPFKVKEECYAAPFIHEGVPSLMVNGFYPFQAVYYSSARSRVIVAFAEAFDSFDTLKSSFQGQADPGARSGQTFRSFLAQVVFKARHPELTTSMNGFHMSASEVDGAREYSAFRAFIEREFTA